MKTDAPGYAGSLILILIGIAAIFTGVPHLWGLHFAWYLPAWFAGVIVLLMLVLWLPPVAGRLSRSIEFVSAETAPGKTCWAWLPMAIVVTGLALLFPAETYLLGDAPLRLNQVDAGRLLLTTEIGDFFFHAVLQRYILGPLGLNAAENYALVAALMSIPYIAGCYFFSRRLDPARWVAWFIVLLTSGAVVQFFGYVESYAILLTLLPWVIWAALRVADTGRGVVLFVILYLLAALTHFVGAILLSGTLAAVVLARIGRDERVIRRGTAVLALAALAAVTAAYVARAAGLFEARSWLIPIRPDETFAYGLLTADHALNLFNWLVLSAPLVLALPLLLIGRGQPASGRRASGRLALARLTLLSSGLFMLLFAPRLGGPRDWDLFAVAAVVMLAASLIWLAIRRSGPLPRPVVPIIGLALATTVAFVAVNASANRSVERFADVIEVGPVKNLYHEYANLCDHCRRYPELSDRLDDFAVAAWKQPPYRTVDSAEALGYLLQYYDEVKHPDSLIDSLTARLDLGRDTYAFYDLLARLWTGTGSAAQKVALAFRMYELFPDRARAMMRTGSLWAQVGNREAAREALEAAYAMDSGDPSILATYGQFLFATGRTEDARAVLARAAKAAPDDFRAQILAAQSAAALGDTVQAMDFLDQAASAADSPAKSQAVADWRQRLERGESR